MANKVGPLIKEARTAAKLSQEELAKKIDGVSAADISKAERGEKELSQTALKQIAKATGVTQKSLLEAAAASTYKKPGSDTKKNTDSKTSSSGKKTTSSKSDSSSKTTSNQTSIKVTATEKKLIELYRAADSETKKNALKILKGEEIESGDLLTNLISGAVDMFMKK